MKNYAKVVQAVQFLGDIKVLKDILDKKDVILDKDNAVYLYKESGFVEAGYWKLKENDFVIKEGNTISVYKEAKFLSEYDEVLVEDVVKDVKEIKVKEFIEVKSEKNVASQVVDKSKKE